MSDSENILDKDIPHVENGKITGITSLRITVEKLDGGFISDVEGRRKIYRDTEDVIEAIGVDKLLNGIKKDEYKLNIDLVPSDEHENYVDALNFGTELRDKEKSTPELLNEVIEENKFNPNIIKNRTEFSKNIKVTEANAYSMARLSAIDWVQLDKELPMKVNQIAEICGGNKTSMYSIWKNVKNGKANFRLTQTRIQMTILAKFYEISLGIKTSSKDKNEKLLANIREIETMNTKSGFIKLSEITKKLNEMKKILLT